MPVLSIIIPAYNEGAFLRTLLERIVAVPVERMGFEKELVVVNDGSKDDTEAVARRFAETCTQTPIRVFTQVPNQGKGKAVQRGIQESTSRPDRTAPSIAPRVPRVASFVRPPSLSPKNRQWVSNRESHSLGIRLPFEKVIPTFDLERPH
jgi:glycosyltransferase involved in cell wall biosynthesis